MTTVSDNKLYYGIVLVVLAVFMMSIQDALFKYLSDYLGLWQIFSLRALLTLPLFFVIFRLQRQPRRIWLMALQPWAVCRALLFATSFIALYAAMPFVSLSTVAAGYYTAPIFMAILSVIFLGERISLLGFVSVLTGFVGVLVILRPSTDSFSTWALLPVVGGFAYGTANIVTRGRCQSINATALALALNMALLMIGLVASVFLWQMALPIEAVEKITFLLTDWSPISVVTSGLLLTLTILVIAIAICVASAYQISPPAVIATFEYCYLIFVALWDWLIFQSPPTGLTLLGIALIVVSGVLVSRCSKAART